MLAKERVREKMREASSYQEVIPFADDVFRSLSDMEFRWRTVQIYHSKLWNMFGILVRIPIIK